MKKKIIFSTSFAILFFSFLFLYFKISSDKKLIEENKKIELIEKKNNEIGE